MNPSVDEADRTHVHAISRARQILKQSIAYSLIFSHLLLSQTLPQMPESWGVRLMPEISLRRQKPLKIIRWQNTRLTPESSICNAPAWHFIPCFISLYHTNPYTVYHSSLKCHELGVLNQTSLSFFFHFFLFFFIIIFFLAAKQWRLSKGLGLSFSACSQSVKALSNKPALSDPCQTKGNFHFPRWRRRGQRGWRGCAVGTEGTCSTPRDPAVPSGAAGVPHAPCGGGHGAEAPRGAAAPRASTCWWLGCSFWVVLGCTELGCAPLSSAVNKQNSKIFCHGSP